MRSLLCRLLGHNLMVTTARRRECQRCGMQETLKNLGNVMAWQEVDQATGRDSKH